MHDHQRGTDGEETNNETQRERRTAEEKETKVWLGDRGLSSRVIGALVRTRGDGRDRFLAERRIEGVSAH